MGRTFDITLDDSDTRALLDAVRHACDDMYATIQDESGRDADADATRQHRLDAWERVASLLSTQLRQGQFQ